jgi:hypothetical protein
MFRYEYSNDRRIDCPMCGKKGKFSACKDKSTGQLAPLEYGICSSCGKYKLPPENYLSGGSSSTIYEDETIAYYEADTIDPSLAERFYHSTVNNTFVTCLENIFGAEKVKRAVELYHIGRFDDNGIVFPYYYTDSHLCSAKIIFYDNNLHRIRDGKKSFPRWLHNLKYTNDAGVLYDYNDYDIEINGTDCIETPSPFDLKLSLFGHNQIINHREKPICLVESEKTALIMSIVMPNFIWVASGGKTLIQDYKFNYFTGRKCYAFPDLSPDDNVYKYWSDKFDFYNRKFGYDISLVDYYQEYYLHDQNRITKFKNRKHDVVDFVLKVKPLDHYIAYLKSILKEKDAR